MHPNAVGHHDVIERAVQALEVRTNVSPILLVRQLARHPVQPSIRPRVVVGHHCEVRPHDLPPSSVQ
jgi:hypothetical protein